MTHYSESRTFLSISDVCKKTGFTPAYIRRLLREEPPRLEGFKAGPIWFVYNDSLESFISQPRKRGRPQKESQQVG